MSFMNQFRSVIEWKNPAPESLFEKWSSSADEIKNASKLIVGPGQGCIFVYEGKVQTVYTEPGMVELKTANIPFWTTVTKLMQGFVSEHKVGLYFYKQAQLVDIKWGSSSPIKYDDPKYKFPVALRAFGNFSVQIQKPEWFFTNVIASRDIFSISELRNLIVSRIIQPLSESLATAKFNYSEIDSHRGEIANQFIEKTKTDFDKLGFTLIDFRVEGTSFDEDTMKRINRIANITAESQAANAAGVSYAEMQQLEAMREAAKNPGAAGMMMGMGVGMGLGQPVASVATGTLNEDAPIRLKKLKELLDQGLINEEEFNAKKKEILAKL